MTPPEWLVRHDGTLRLATDGRTWLVFFDGAPHYNLTPSPAVGRFACQVCQTENGKRIDKVTTFASADEALRGGLEELRTFLGW
ncbi:MAG TPA: hypothetical protein VH120_20210 [Gemmataceae bacterium]|nr:hypothetical protein [Gemmataceae bacterium]